MLKLKYLFENKDLALMILKNWEFDAQDSDLFKYFRISANAVYWCRNNGTTFFLRFSPDEEKSREWIISELEFLKYLRMKGYPAVETIMSKNNQELETIQTPWGKYHAVCFKKVKGKQLSLLPLNNELIFGWGKALGKLHKLSSLYQPSIKRSSWLDKLNWMGDVLNEYPNEITAKNELINLKSLLSNLEVTNENYGLVHYDFETDNVFYDEETNTFNSIDYDDCMYHWFLMDIVQSLDTIEDDFSFEKMQEVTKSFIDGYKTEFFVSDIMLAKLPLFKRFAKLYSYTRVLRSVSEKWNNEPQWMVNLRIKLNDFLERTNNNFHHQNK